MKDINSIWESKFSAKLFRRFLLCCTLPIWVFVTNTGAAQTADFSFSTPSGNFCIPATISFRGTYSETPRKVIWNFGLGGESSQDLTPSFLYSQPGVYNIKLSVLFNSKLVVVEKTIQVFGAPSLTLSSNRNYLCQPGAVSFTARSFQRIASVVWNMGDGSLPITNTDTVFNHAYTTLGSYTPSVTIRDQNGCTNTSTVSMVVQPLTGSVKVNPPVACLPAAVGFKAVVNLPTGDRIAGFTWAFGDGSPAETNNQDSVSHQYVNPFSGIASVRVTTSEGCVNTIFTDSLYFGNRPGPLLLTTSKPTQCFSEPFNVTATSANANTIVWQVGNGPKDSSRRLVFSARPTQRGTFFVKATPYFNGCPGTTDSVRVEVVGVQASFRFQNTCQDKATFAFRNASSGVVNQFRWTFSGIDSSTNSAAPNITFPPQGAFQVKMVVFQSSTNCYDSVTQTVFTYKPRLNTPDSLLCRNGLYSINVENAPNASIASYTWNIAGLPLSTERDSIRTFRPTINGIFSNSVVIRLNSSYCNDTLMGSFPVRVAGPVAAFNNAPAICAGTPFYLSNLSNPAFAGDTLKQWYWEIGNRLFTSDKAIPDSVLFTSRGNFRIIHRVTDINGCVDEARGTVAVRLNPLLSVFPSEVSFCQGAAVNLEAFSENPLKWQPSAFVDCDSCPRVRAALPNSGMVYVSTTDTLGCFSFDSVKLTARVPYVFNPTLSDTGFCQGAGVQLNSGLSGLRTRWSPAEGLSNPEIPNPVASPTATTLYRLEVVDSFYCFTNNTEVLVEVWPLPGIEPIPDVIAPFNSSFQFQLNYTTPDIATYTWLPPGQLSCTNCTSPIVTATQSKDYVLRLVSSNGCISETSARVIIECNPDNLLLPNAFTPNSDGLNERFFPVGRGISSINKFLVYNRNGELVYSRFNFAPGDRNFGWDGKLNGRHQASGTFVYMVEALCDLGKTLLKKGTVLLIR